MSDICPESTPCQACPQPTRTESYLRELTVRICRKHSLNVCSSCLLQSGRSSPHAIHKSAINQSRSWPSSYLPLTTFGSHCWPGRTCNIGQVCNSQSLISGHGKVVGVDQGSCDQMACNLQTSYSSLQIAN